MNRSGHHISRWQTLFYWGLAAVFVAWQVRLHFDAGYTLPTPWPDEAHFLWPAAAFADGLTLFAEQLHPQRMILWMPPGYMVFQGMIFMVAGLSLDVARTTSLLLMLAAFGMLVTILRPFRMAGVCLGLTGLCFITGPAVAAGNVARPEALLLAVVVGGFWLILSNRPIPGLALLALSPLIHPNGLFFVAAGILAFTWKIIIGRQRWRLTQGDLWWLGSVGALWLAYATLAATHWDGWLHDMAYQMGRKSGRELLAPLLTAENTALILVILLAGFYALRNQLRAGQLLILGLPAWLAFQLGHEMWYHVYRQIGLLLILVFLVQVFGHLLSSVSADNTKFPRRAALAMVLLAMLVFAYQKEAIPTADSNPANLTWQEFRVADSIPYLAAEDIAAVEMLLDSLDTGERPLTVQVRPHGDAFLIPGFVEGRYRTLAPVFTEAKPDIYVVHRSRYLPRSVYHEAEKQDLLASGHKVFDAEFMFHQRQAWERWYCFPNKNLAASANPVVHR